MALKVPIRFRGDQSKTGLEAERVFDVAKWFVLHNRTSNALKLVVAKALESFELTSLEWIVMSRIAADETGEYTITKLAEDFDMNVPQAAVLIKSLAKRNLIKQKVSSKDRRVKFLSCSRRGMKMVYDAEQSVQHAMRYWLFDLSDKEIEAYEQIMKKISKFEIPQSFS